MEQLWKKEFPHCGAIVEFLGIPQFAHSFNKVWNTLIFSSDSKTIVILSLVKYHLMIAYLAIHSRDICQVVSHLILKDNCKFFNNLEISNCTNRHAELMNVRQTFEENCPHSDFETCQSRLHPIITKVSTLTLSGPGGGGGGLRGPDDQIHSFSFLLK